MLITTLLASALAQTEVRFEEILNDTHSVAAANNYGPYEIDTDNLFTLEVTDAMKNDMLDTIDAGGDVYVEWQWTYNVNAGASSKAGVDGSTKFGILNPDLPPNVLFDLPIYIHFNSGGSDNDIVTEIVYLTLAQIEALETSIEDDDTTPDVDESEVRDELAVVVNGTAVANSLSSGGSTSASLQEFGIPKLHY